MIAAPEIQAWAKGGERRTVDGVELFYRVAGEDRADRAAGRVELMAFPGFEGRDLSGRTSAAARGIVSLRFPSTDLDARLADLRARGAEIVLGPGRIDMPPFFAARAVTVRSPDGAWLTWFQPEAASP